MAQSVGQRPPRVLDALICQHFRYWQRDNGDLDISLSGFCRAGVSNDWCVRLALKELLKLGLIEIKKGKVKRHTEHRPNLYGLTMYKREGGFIESANHANRAFV
jgi:hypothetical protein